MNNNQLDEWSNHKDNPFERFVGCLAELFGSFIEGFLPWLIALIIIVLVGGTWLGGVYWLTHREEVNPPTHKTIHCDECEHKGDTCETN